MNHTKESIRQLIMEGQLSEAGAAALSYAEYCGIADIVNALTVITSQAKLHKEQWSTGQISYEKFSLGHAQTIKGLADWVDRLPDQPKQGKKGRTKLLSEDTFKKRVFYLLCIIKLLVIFRLAYHWSTGGFSNDQFQATVALLAPALAAYVSVMLADYLRQQKLDLKTPRYLSGPLVTFSYWLFPIYGIMLFMVIEMKAKTSITFTQMNFWLAFVEVILGGYIGQIVFSFFKKE